MLVRRRRPLPPPRPWSLTSPTSLPTKVTLCCASHLKRWLIPADACASASLSSLQSVLPPFSHDSAPDAGNSLPNGCQRACPLTRTMLTRLDACASAPAVDDWAVVLLDENPEPDQSVLDLWAAPAIDKPFIAELPTGHEHGMPSVVQASSDDAAEECAETVVVDVDMESQTALVPAMVDDVAPVASSDITPTTPGPAAIALQTARNQLFAELDRRRDHRVRIEPSVEWKGLPRRKTYWRVRPRAPIPSKRREDISPEEIDGHDLTFDRRWSPDEFYRTLLRCYYHRAKRSAKVAEERRKLQEAAAKRAAEAQRLQRAKAEEEQRKLQEAAAVSADEARRLERAAATGAKRAAQRAEHQRKLQEAVARRQLLAAKLRNKAR
jgi:hypothetical protein